MNESITVLLVEDRVEDAELLIRELRKGGLEIVAHRVDTREALEQALEDLRPDVILCDYSLPGFGGMTALQTVKQHCPDTPLIFVSGTIGEERAIEALRQGATDYVLKDNRARLVPAVRRSLTEANERLARRRTESELEESERRFRLFMQHLPGAAF
jgi:CheY-like chemotaxis protein